MAEMTMPSARHYLADLRNARASALADAENFDAVLFAIERLGAYLHGSGESLGKYRPALRRVASRSALAWTDNPNFSANTERFERLFDLVLEARNDAMHQGAAARHITRHCVELALILEDALMTGMKQIRDFMVTAPTEGKLFEPVGSIRRTMLMNSFSYLPVKMADGWQLISDAAVAKFLRDADSNSGRKQRLGMQLEEAINNHGLELIRRVKCCLESDDIAEVVADLNERPVLVLRDINTNGELVGLVAAFDFL